MEALSMNWKNCIFSECQMIFHNLEHPVSLWVNFMAERQGKEWKGNGEGVKEKKGKREKAGGKGRKGKGGNGNGKGNRNRKGKPYMAEGFSISRQSWKNLAFSDPLILTWIGVFGQEWVFLEFHFKLTFVSCSLSYEAWDTNHRFMKFYKIWGDLNFSFESRSCLILSCFPLP